MYTSPLKLSVGKPLPQEGKCSFMSVTHPAGDEGQDAGGQGRGAAADAGDARSDAGEHPGCRHHGHPHFCSRPKSSSRALQTCRTWPEDMRSRRVWPSVGFPEPSFFYTCDAPYPSTKNIHYCFRIIGIPPMEPYAARDGDTQNMQKLSDLLLYQVNVA